ncbi:MAG: hypothetical protein LBG69_06035 [Zoogloeaceae bacterium]|nr:hypothetical protein [Zoogloeaceae bacterium]
MNMPTPASSITGTYISEEEYSDWECPKMSREYNRLAERENVLAYAQEQRYQSSQAQAFWYGYGQGDGVEAFELASVRGRRNAIRNAMNNKNCANKNHPR